MINFFLKKFSCLISPLYMFYVLFELFQGFLIIIIWQNLGNPLWQMVKSECPLQKSGKICVSRPLTNGENWVTPSKASTHPVMFFEWHLIVIKGLWAKRWVSVNLSYICGSEIKPTSRIIPIFHCHCILHTPPLPLYTNHNLSQLSDYN